MNQTIAEKIQFIIRKDDPRISFPSKGGNRGAWAHDGLKYLALSVFMVASIAHQVGMINAVVCVALYAPLAFYLIVPDLRNAALNTYLPPIFMGRQVYTGPREGRIVALMLNTQGMELNYLEHNVTLSWPQLEAPVIENDTILFRAKNGIEFYIPRRAADNDDQWKSLIATLRAAYHLHT